MAKNDWFRRRTWTAKDRKEFFIRLGRTRADYNKAQYLRIQACTLQTEASPPDHAAALDLLDHMLREVPHPDEVAAAQLQRAKCLETLGRVEEAVDAYRASIRCGLNRNNVQTTDASFHFAAFVVKQNLKKLYNEALSNLKCAEIIAVLPSHRYLLCCLTAMMADEDGRAHEARKHARKAIEISTSSVLPNLDGVLHARIVKLAG